MQGDDRAGQGPDCGAGQTAGLGLPSFAEADTQLMVVTRRFGANVRGNRWSLSPLSIRFGWRNWLFQA